MKYNELQLHNLTKGDLTMNFERLILTKDYEFYRFSQDYSDVAYLLLTDNFKKAPNNFGETFFDDDFSPNNNNWITVQCATRKDLDEHERQEILSFVEGLLSFKPSIDYMMDFFYLSNDLEFNYLSAAGFVELTERINLIFNSAIKIQVGSSF